MPMSYSTLVKKRLYIRCRTACSLPPTYWYVGIQRRAASGSNGPSVYSGEMYRRKYQDESTKVSIVSVSRSAGPPHCGQVVATQSRAPARGDTASVAAAAAG